MARRAGGKAATRKARQRNVPRPQRPPGATFPAPSDVPPPASGVPPTSSAARAIPPVGTPDAREAASLTPPRRITPPLTATAGSRLTATDRAEYHYVERDLRSMAILTAVMVVLLIAAWALFNSLGLTG